MIWAKDQLGDETTYPPRAKLLSSGGLDEQVDELNFQEFGVTKDIERLKALHDLFAEVLNHLCKIGSAYEGDPGVAL